MEALCLTQLPLSGALPVASGATQSSINFDSPKEKSLHLVGFPHHTVWLNLRGSKSLLCVYVEWYGNSKSIKGVYLVSLWFPLSPLFVSFYTYKAGGESSANMGESSETFLQLFCCCLQSTCRDRVLSENMLYCDSQSKRFSANSLEANNARKTTNVNGNRRLWGNRIILWFRMFTRKSRKMGYWFNYQSWSN